MKSLIVKAVAAILAISGLAACGGSDGGGDNSQHVTGIVTIAGDDVVFVSLNTVLDMASYVRVLPMNADNRQIVVTSSNSSVVSVSDGGTVKAVGQGVATLTVTTVDGGHDTRFTVKVVDVTAITFTPVVDGKTAEEAWNVDLQEGGEAYTARVLVAPFDELSFRATSSDTEVVTAVVVQDDVERQSVRFTPVGAGSAVVTIQSVLGGPVGTFHVTVSE
ncbi:MAG: Ig-like domain-containing protein [Prevotella sp.]|nr:Ig-like domain-containing protein [Prevotella sp.]